MEKKKEKSVSRKFLGHCISHPRFQHDPCQSILKLMTWRSNQPLLLCCKPKNMELVPSHTIYITIFWTTAEKQPGATCRPSPGNPRLGIWMWGWRAGRSWGLSSWLGSSGNWRGERERKATVINKKAVLHAGINWSKLGMRLQSGSPVSVVLYQHKPMQPPALARLCSNSYSSLNRLDLHLSVLPTWIGLHKKKHRININKHNTQL